MPRSGKVYGFGSDATVRRVVDAVRWCEGQRKRESTSPAAKLSGSIVALVELTGPLTGGLYPAKAVTWDDAAQEWVELGDVRFHDANGGEEWDAPTRALARYSGPTADGMYGLFVGPVPRPEAMQEVTISVPSEWTITDCVASPSSYKTYTIAGVGVSVIAGDTTPAPVDDVITLTASPNQTIYGPNGIFGSGP